MACRSPLIGALVAGSLLVAGTPVPRARAETDVTAVQLGAAIAVSTYADQLAKLPPASREPVLRYDSYLAERGERALADLLAGRPLAADDAPFVAVLKATAIHRGIVAAPGRPADPACQAFADNVLQSGLGALKRGYQGAPLTDADRNRLADYAIYLGVKRTGAKKLPFQLGLAPAVQEFNVVGQEVPDFRAMRLETALASPAYRDVRACRPDFFLGEEGLTELTNLLSGYEQRDGRIVARSQPLAPERDDSGFVRLSDLRGKPTVLILADPADCFFPRCFAIAESISRAWHAQASFLFVHVTIHDTTMHAEEYFGPSAGSRALFTHPLTLEQRARTAKLLYMRYPNVTIPFVLDDMSETIRNAYEAEGGDARIVLLDADGRLAFNARGWWYYEGGDASDDTLWANALEQALCRLATHGIGATGTVIRPPAVTKAPRFEDQAKVEAKRARRGQRNLTYWHRGRGGQVWLVGSIVGLNATTGTVDVAIAPMPAGLPGIGYLRAADGVARLTPVATANRTRVEKWAASAGKTLRFTTDPTVELFLNGREARLADFSTGDVVGVMYDPADEDQATILPDQIRASRPPR